VKKIINIKKSFSVHYKRLNDWAILHVKSRSIGMVVAARYKNVWYRGEILCFLGFAAFVNLVDYGRQKLIQISDLRLLHATFAKNSRKSFPASLYGVKPAENMKLSLSWSVEAMSVFMNKTKGFQIFAKAKGKVDEVYEVKIFDGLNSQRSFGDYLKELGYAQYKL
jgi:hypothetical protein